MYKKMRFYIPLLAILWSGALVQSFAGETENFKGKNTIEAIQKEDPKLLLEKEIAGKMNETEMEQEAQALLQSYDGEMVKEIIGENYFSFYGYTNKISNWIVADGERINLNLVITYDETRDVTKIVWATPFWNEDF